MKAAASYNDMIQVQTEDIHVFSRQKNKSKKETDFNQMRG